MRALVEPSRVHQMNISQPNLVAHRKRVRTLISRWEVLVVKNSRHAPAENSCTSGVPKRPAASHNVAGAAPIMIAPYITVMLWMQQQQSQQPFPEEKVFSAFENMIWYSRPPHRPNDRDQSDNMIASCCMRWLSRYQ